MNRQEALRVVEQLRKGIPPEGYTRHFTVGRRSEIKKLTDRLQTDERGALLLRANYGSGKSHLLRYVREEALDQGYAVSSVTLDAKSAVRFNRMDQILGAIWRGLELPGNTSKGVRPLLNRVCESAEAAKNNGRTPFWTALTNQWKWDLSNTLEAPAMFVAVRAWATGRARTQDLVEDWLFQPWAYQSQRKRLYAELIEGVRPRFVDPRPEWKFYGDGVFVFNVQAYHQSWSALRDIETLVCQCGLKGLVILFDEFEDVLTNLRNIAHQEAAFWNLFSFYEGQQFKGTSFFAVTPEFADKCTRLLLEKDRWEFDYERFETLPTFAMSPLRKQELEELAGKVLETHGNAYAWSPGDSIAEGTIQTVVAQASALAIQDRTRHTIREVVKLLDRALDDL
jgi:hypothetical protein